MTLGVCPRAAGIVFGCSLLFVTLAVMSVAERSMAAPDASAPRTASCTVLLDRLSYDDPGVDDEEWIQLGVVRDDSALTFADCGVGGLELLNGSGAGCPVYERIELGSMAIPSDGRLVLCSPQSSLGAVCKGATDDGNVLDNGWLQNGPDGVRLTAVDGSELWSAGYGGELPCDVEETFPGDRDVASSSGTASDGVLVRCGNEFELVAAEDAMPGQAVSCPEPIEPTAVASSSPATSAVPSSPTQTSAAAPMTAPAVPSGAPDVTSSAASDGTTAPLGAGSTNAAPVDPFGSIADAGVHIVSRATIVDAAAAVEVNEQSGSAADRHPPKLPSAGCQLSRAEGPGGLGWLWNWSFIIALTACAIRRRLAGVALRCSATSVAGSTRLRFAWHCGARLRR